jgi:transcriptional regulator with XRE-family HTH domain
VSGADPVDSRHQVVSRRLRERRRALGLTQKQVVTRLSRLGVRMTNKTLSCQERGAGLDVARLPDLARALDCTTTYLLGLTEDPQRWHPDDVPAPPPATAPPDAHSWILGPGVPGYPVRLNRTGRPL